MYTCKMLSESIIDVKKLKLLRRGVEPQPSNNQLMVNFP
jgi:hypothetical protein